MKCWHLGVFPVGGSLLYSNLSFYFSVVPQGKENWEWRILFSYPYLPVGLREHALLNMAILAQCIALRALIACTDILAVTVL